MGEERSTTKESPLHDRSNIAPQIIIQQLEEKIFTLLHECIQNTFSLFNANLILGRDMLFDGRLSCWLQEGCCLTGNVFSTTKRTSLMENISYRHESTSNSIHRQVFTSNQFFSDTKFRDSKYFADALDNRFSTAREAVT